jgi:hypothetical protein
MDFPIDPGHHKEAIAMAERIAGEMTRVDVRIEVYDLHFEEADEQLEEYRRDPSGFMRRFLEQQGHSVNRIQFIRREEYPYRSQQEKAGDSSPIEQRMPDRNYHIVYPDNEASGWICCCA